ncbi:NAD-dependent epimerase/dehydratase family protein [Flavobacteriaceae bacterium]|nr:NAD-dependent epimerase/dehydratase family protein [Flavobacteriaceae bacterium]
MVYITGITGFIGQNLSHYLGEYLVGVNLRKQEPLVFEKGAAVVHLAGKAHDLKKTLATSEYFTVNTKLTKIVFNAFLASEAGVFVFMSTVKAEEGKEIGASAYSQSKYQAEEYILAQKVPAGKRVYVLRPVMVHGPGNKGNLNVLFGAVKRFGIWPLAAFENQRSFVSVENLCFVIKELIANENVASGVYAVADEEALSTNELVALAGEAIGKKVAFWKVPKGLVYLLAKLGDVLPLPLNSERLEKLTENAVVDARPLLKALGIKSLPLRTLDGFKKTFDSFVHE